MRPAVVTAALGATLVVCWSSGFVGATLGTGTAPVLTVLAWRTSICAALLVLAVLVRHARSTDSGSAAPRIRHRSVARQAGNGLLVQVVYLGGVFAAAAATVPAGTTALITAMQPLVVALLARPLLGTRVSPRQLTGLVVGAAGVVVVVAGDLGAGAWWANLLPVVAVAGLATGTLLEGRGGPQPPLLTSLAVQTTVAAVVFTSLAAANGQLAPPADIRFWQATAWLVLLSSFGGYGAYLALVRRTGPTFASTLLFLTPPTTALWAWAMFDQRPGWVALPGVVVTAVGVAILTIGRVTGGPAPAPRSRPRSAAAPASRDRRRVAVAMRRQASRT